MSLPSNSPDQPAALRTGTPLTHTSHTGPSPTAPALTGASPAPGAPARSSTVVEVARSMALVGGFAVAGTDISSTVLNLATGAAGTGALLASLLPMLAAMLAYTTGYRRVAAAAIVLVVAAEVVTAALYGPAGAVVAVLPLVVVVGVAVALRDDRNGPGREGEWWRGLVLLALPAGVASAAVWLAGVHVRAVGSDRAFPLLLATVGVLVAAVIYALSLGRGVRRRVHLIALAALFLGAFPSAVWGLYIAGGVTGPEHGAGRGPAGFALLVLFVAFRVALVRVGRPTASGEPR